MSFLRFLDNAAAAARKGEMTAEAVTKMGKAAHTARPLSMPKGKTLGGLSGGPMHGPSLPLPPRPTGRPNMSPLVPPKGSRMNPRSPFDQKAHQVSNWVKGHKKLVYGAGGLAIAGTAISNSTGPGSPKGSGAQARGMYGF